ncbi:MAG: GC-type dockerin domain-anchored protein [Planctomycetota bacterium]
MRRAIVIMLAAGGCAALADEVRMTHLVVSDLVTAGEGIACAGGDPQTTTDNNYWTSFTLSDFGVDAELRVREIEFGVEQLQLPSFDDITIDVNLYIDEPFARPTIGLPLLASTSITLQPTSLDIVSVGIDALVPSDLALIVEIAVPDLWVGGLTGGDVFFPGSNGFGSTDSTYISSIACGLFEPWESCGFGGCFTMLKTVIGNEVCSADIDDDGDLTIFDFLAFQTLFDAGDLRADFDGDGALTIFDFLDFQTAFDAGC